MNEKYNLIDEEKLEKEELKAKERTESEENQKKAYKEKLDNWARESIKILLQYGYLKEEEIKITRITI